jgi:hypothetical protein
MPAAFTLAFAVGATATTIPIAKDATNAPASFFFIIKTLLIEVTHEGCGGETLCEHGH